MFISAKYHDDPEATRDSVLRLPDVPIQVLCIDHGVPITKTRALRRANCSAKLSTALGRPLVKNPAARARDMRQAVLDVTLSTALPYRTME